MDFSLGILIPLDGKKKTPQEQLKAQVEHFELLERRKLTKKEINELWEIINEKESQRKSKNQLWLFFAILLLSLMGIAYIVFIIIASRDAFK